MNANDLNQQVLKTLEAYETLAPIEPSGGWQDHVLAGIESARMHPERSGKPAGMIFLVLFFVLLNTGYFLTSYFYKSTTSDNREEDLQTISTELLINPSSVTN